MFKQIFSFKEIFDLSQKKADLTKVYSAKLHSRLNEMLVEDNDERTNENISFYNGNISLDAIKQKVDSKEYVVAFILKPIPFSSIKKVADNNEILSPKSTYVEPKLRSGLTIYPIK